MSVANIDEALGCFRMEYHLENDVLHVTPRRNEITMENNHNVVTNHDWILDGHEEWHLQYKKTAELFEELYPTGPNANTFDTDSLLLQLGSPMGTQEYQFAQFDSIEIKNTTPAAHWPTITPSATQKTEFKQFWKQAITAHTPCQTFDQGSTESAVSSCDDPNFPDNVMDPIDKFLIEKMAAHALGRDVANDDEDADNDDFGDFQQATEADNAKVKKSAEENVDFAGESMHETDDDAPDDDRQAADVATGDASPMKHANPQDDDGFDDEVGGGEHDNGTSDEVEQLRNDREVNDELAAAPVDENADIPPHHVTDNTNDKPTVEATNCQSSSHKRINDGASNDDASDTSNNFMPNASPPPKQVSDERYNATLGGALPVEPPTPVTRNYYPSPLMALDVADVDNDASSASSVLSPQRKFQFDCAGRETQSDNESESQEESILWTQHSKKEDHSIPKEVQLISNQRNSRLPRLPPSSVTPAKDQIAIPQMVRISSTQASTYAFNTPSSLSSPSFYFCSSSTPNLVATSLFSKFSTMDKHEDEPSIASSLASPEVKFLRRHCRESSKHRRAQSTGSLSYQKGADYNEFGAEHDDEEDDDAFDEEESMSLGSLGTMPENYLKHPDHDFLLQELNKLDWDWLPFWRMDRLLDEDYDENGNLVCDTSKIPLFHQQITERLSKLDVFYNKVEKKVYQKIQPHAEELIYANQLTLDLQKNIQLAQMYLGRTKNAIQIAKYGSKGTAQTPNGLGVHGALELLDNWDKLASQQGMVSVVQALSDILDLESHILERIKALNAYQSIAFAECQSIVNLVEDLKDSSHSPIVLRLQCLEDLRKRADDQIVQQALMCRLHELLGEMVAQCCSTSQNTQSLAADLDAYERLMDSFQLVFHKRQGDDQDSRVFSSAICTTIHTASLLEAQKAFGRSLLSPSKNDSVDYDDDCHYATELNALRYNESFMDAARLPIWTHNLVTIRFDFEMASNKHPLPHVFHKLCWLLTNVLFGMKRIIKWHDQKCIDMEIVDKAQERSNILIDLIHEELPKRRASLWNACIQSLEGCIEEYLKYVGNKKLFTSNGDALDDFQWREDLEGLHDVLSLADQFLSLNLVFVQDVPSEILNDGSLIRDKLEMCCKRHVRTFHVATMNTLGGMLHREDWQLLPFRDVARNVDAEAAAMAILQEINQHLFNNNTDQTIFKHRSTVNGFQKTENGYQIASNDNPFDILEGRAGQVNNTTSFGTDLDWSNTHAQLIVNTLVKFFGNETGHNNTVMTKCMIYGIIPCCARVFLLLKKLPSMSTQSILVLSNIFDLYIATAFRLAAGNARNERVLLGLDTPKHFVKSGEIDALVATRFASQSFGGFGRRSSQASISSNDSKLQHISKSVEAEMSCFSAQDAHKHNLLLLCDLIMAAQVNLQGIAKLDLVNAWIGDPSSDEDEEEFAALTARVLEKRAAASLNVVCLAATLHLSANHVAAMDSHFVEYRNKFVTCMPTFMKLTHRMITMRSICGQAIVSEIVSLENAWEESKLHEHPNDYVENLVDFCSLLWRNLSLSKQKLPNGLLEMLWDDLVAGGFLTLVEGFSKVTCCSTEGRALMSMDVAAYRAIGEKVKDDSKVLSPSLNQSFHYAQYVDAFIKMHYFPYDEALAWIQDSWGNYHYNHMMALVMATATNASEAKKGIQMLNGLYSEDPGSANSNKDAKMIRL
jgi:hypothetical protein